MNIRISNLDKTFILNNYFGLEKFCSTIKHFLKTCFRKENKKVYNFMEVKQLEELKNYAKDSIQQEKVM